MSELAAYIVKNEKLSLSIAIVNIDSLHLHEEIIPELIESLTQSIKADGCVRHPIIVDKESLVVLDGVHRVAALRKLGIRRVPACFVDYNNPNIKVGSWYRTITGASTPQQILTQIEQIGGVTIKMEKANEDQIGVSPTVAAIGFKNKAYFINFSFHNLKEAYNIIKCVEENLKGKRLGIRFETQSDAFKSLRKGQVDAVLCTPKLGKKDVIETALSGQVFASKATRHVIPARLMGLNVPLSLLKNQKKPLSRINEELKSMLQKRRLKRILSGSVLEGRRYEEELYVFEE